MVHFLTTWLYSGPHFEREDLSASIAKEVGPLLVETARIMSRSVAANNTVKLETIITYQLNLILLRQRNHHLVAVHLEDHGTVNQRRVEQSMYNFQSFPHSQRIKISKVGSFLLNPFSAVPVQVSEDSFSAFNHYVSSSMTCRTSRRADVAYHCSSSFLSFAALFAHSHLIIYSSHSSRDTVHNALAHYHCVTPQGHNATSQCLQHSNEEQAIVKPPPRRIR